MPKKSRALKELEAMEFKERRELEQAETARSAIAARLDTIQTLKRRLEEAPKKLRKPVKPAVAREGFEKMRTATDRMTDPIASPGAAV